MPFPQLSEGYAEDSLVSGRFWSLWSRSVSSFLYVMIRAIGRILDGKWTNQPVRLHLSFFLRGIKNKFWQIYVETKFTSLKKITSPSIWKLKNCILTHGWHHLLWLLRRARSLNRIKGFILTIRWPELCFLLLMNPYMYQSHSPCWPGLEIHLVTQILSHGEV